MKFRYLCELLDSLEQLELTELPLPPREKDERYRRQLQKWFNTHRALVNDQAALLSCLLPERRVDRVYSMQRQRFTRAISDCLCLGINSAKQLRNAPEGSDIGKLLEAIVQERGGGHGCVPVTLVDLDRCLANIAAISRWSGPKVRETIDASTTRNQRDILRPIIIRLTSREIKWFTRIFFKNLAPVQLQYNSILRHVNPLLPAMLKVREAFDDALELLRDARLRTHLNENGFNVHSLPVNILNECFRPRIGSKIGRPIFLKARSFKHCAKLVGNRRWAIEPKYDGEYCQLHVDLSKEPAKIQIFSKSGRDSTQDRAAVHSWIRQVLRIGTDCRFKKQCIIEGEIVVVDTRDNSVLEFDKIRRHVSRSGSFLGTNQDSAPRGHEELRIYFYDALLVDDDVLIHRPYEERRKRLSELLPRSPGYSMRGHWGSIDFGKLGPEQKEHQLIRSFRKAHISRYEGLVLKPLDGAYASMFPHIDRDYAGTFIKLKADYIPGLGDSADLAIIGAYTTDQHKVEPELLRQTKWTHFVLACLKNKDDVVLHKRRPTFKIMGVVSRPAISPEDMKYLSQHGHFRIRNVTEFDVDASNRDIRPKVLFNRPFVVDVVGSKFERPANTNHWMLRHPRITRIHVDRFTEDIVSFDELQSLAKEAHEAPADEAVEEAKLMQRIRKVSEPKRPQYIDTNSPANTIATPDSTRSSKTPPAPFVRMDSCEMRAGDQRYVSPVALKNKERKQQPKEQAAVPHVNDRGQKRKIEEPVDVPQPKRRTINRSISDACRRSDDAASTTPLQNISNVPSAERLIHPHRNSTDRTSRLKPPSASKLADNPLSSAYLSISRVFTGGMNMFHASEKPVRSGIPDSLPRGNPLHDSVIFLAPEIPRNGLVEQHFLNLFQPDDITRDLDEWKRERLPHADPLGPIVEESQAHPGHHKLVLVEDCLHAQTEAVIEEVFTIRLGMREFIEVWDWRVLDYIIKLANLDERPDDDDDVQDRKDHLRHQLQRHFIGTIRTTTPEEQAAIEDQLLYGTPVTVASLGNVQRYKYSEAHEGHEPLINVMEHPCERRLARNVVRWAAGETMEDESG